MAKVAKMELSRNAQHAKEEALSSRCNNSDQECTLNLRALAMIVEVKVKL